VWHGWLLACAILVIVWWTAISAGKHSEHYTMSVISADWTRTSCKISLNANWLLNANWVKTIPPSRRSNWNAHFDHLLSGTELCVCYSPTGHLGDAWDPCIVRVSVMCGWHYDNIPGLHHTVTFRCITCHYIFICDPWLFGSTLMIGARIVAFCYPHSICHRGPP